MSVASGEILSDESPHLMNSSSTSWGVPLWLSKASAMTLIQNGSIKLFSLRCSVCRVLFLFNPSAMNYKIVLSSPQLVILSVCRDLLTVKKF